MRLSERPLSRQLIHNWLRLYHGPKLAHAQDWTPHLRLSLPDGDRRGAAYYKEAEIAQLLTFEDFRAMTGPACVVVGSGPSLRFQPLNRLRAHSMIYLNGTLSHMPEYTKYPPTVAIEDERFIWRHFGMLRDHVSEQTGLLLSVSVLRAIAEHDPGWLRNRPVFLIDNLLKPYATPRRAIDSPQVRDIIIRNDEAALSTHPEKGVVPAGTIAFTALQWIMAREPEVIGFAGIDLANADQPRFYETTGQTAKSGILSAQSKILAHFSLAVDICQARGVRLENYSRISALRSIGIAYSSQLDETHQNG